MAEWIVVIKNDSGSTITIGDLGLVIANATQVDAHLQFSYGELTNSDDVRALVNAGTLVLNDGSSDLSASNGVKYLTRVNQEYLTGNHYTKIEADVITDALDVRVTTNEGFATDLQTEVDVIEGGAGLASNGAYVVPVGTSYLGSTTSLADADDALDAHTKTNADDILQEINDRGLADTGLQTEIDGVETGAGLAGDGSYVVPTGTSYLGSTTSLADADDALDAQVMVNEDAIDAEELARTNADNALQTEIDAIETGVGLAANGSYVQPSGTNYLNSTLTLMGADVALDTQIKTNYDLIVQEVSDRQDADDLKVDKAGDTMSGTLTMGANAITSTADPAGPNEFARWGYIETQITAAAAGLDPKASCRAAQLVALPACTYNNGASGVGATLTANAAGVLADQDGITLALNDSFLIWKQVNQAHNGIYTVTTVGDAVTAFVFTRRTDFDGDPGAEVDGGEHTFITEGTVQKGFSFTLVGLSAPAIIGTTALVFDYFSGSAGLIAIQAEVDAIEAGAGLSGDGNYVVPVGTAYLGATTSLADADDTLDVQINLNETAIAAEEIARANADTGLQNEINAIETGVGLDTDGTYIQPVGTNYLNATLSVMGADVALDTQIKANEDAIDALEAGTLDDISVIGGAVYAKDTTRSKWMGPVTTFEFGRKGPTKDQFLHMVGGTASNNAGYRAHRNLTITSLAVQFDAAGTATIEIRKNDNAAVITSITVTAATGAHLDNINIDLAAGDFLQAYVNSLNTVEDPTLRVLAAYNGGAV